MVCKVCGATGVNTKGAQQKQSNIGTQCRFIGIDVINCFRQSSVHDQDICYLLVIVSQSNRFVFEKDSMFCNIKAKCVFRPYTLLCNFATLQLL